MKDFGYHSMNKNGSSSHKPSLSQTSTPSTLTRIKEAFPHQLIDYHYNNRKPPSSNNGKMYHSDDSDSSSFSDIETSSDSLHSSYCTSSDSEPEPIKKEQPVKPFKCKDCAQTFPSHGTFKSHCALVHKNERPFSCKHCGKTYINYGSFESHLLSHVASESKPKASSIGNGIACSKCDKVFAHKHYLKRHFINIHVPNADKPYQCRYCLYGAATRKQIVRHENVHRNERAYKCNLCSKAFNNKKNLKDHTSNHHIRPFKCIHCGKGFGTKRYLKAHVLSVHNNDNRPFQCGYKGCGYGALTAKDIKRHNIKHQSDKPFKCGSCGRRFKLLSYLHGHMDRVHVAQKVLKRISLPPKPKETKRPKKPLTAFFVFNKEVRSVIKRENPEFGVTDIARELGRRWNALSVKDKKPYHNVADRLRERFLCDLALYKKSSAYKEYQAKVHKWKIECVRRRNEAREASISESDSDSDASSEDDSESDFSSHLSSQSEFSSDYDIRD